MYVEASITYVNFEEKRGRTMRKKIVIIMILIGVLIITLMTFVMANFNERLMIDSALKNNEDIAHVIAVTMDKYLNEISKTAKTLASSPVIRDTLLESNSRLESLSNDYRNDLIDDLNNKWIDTDDINDPFIQNYLSNPVAAYLKYQQEIIPDYYGEIFLTNKYGELVATTGKLSTLAHGHKYWWTASYNDGVGRVFFDDRGFDTSVDGYVLGVVVPVYDSNDNIIGILKSNINITDLFDHIINEYSALFESGTIRIARTNGLVVFEPNQIPLSTTLDEVVISKIKDKETSEIIKNGRNEDVLLNIASITNTEGSIEIGFGGSYESIDHIQGNSGESWVVVLIMPKTIISEQMRAIMQQFIIVGIILLAIELILIFVFARRITKPIVELVNVTKDINHGNLDKQINISSKDEIGELVESFKNMIIRIKDTMASRDELVKEIIKREKLEKANLKMEAKLRQQQRLESIGTLASGVAHEINNPLNGILNYSQLILDESKKGSDTNEFAKEIIDETNRIVDIVKNLIQFSVQEKQGFSKTNINDLIDKTVSLIKTLIKQDQIDIQINIQKGLPDITCRSRQIQQVLMHLLTNARDALNQKYEGYDINKKLKLTCEKIKKEEKDWIRITVEDCGSGISKDAQNKILDPFFTTKGRAEGTGLGLYVSYGIVKEHNGELTFETKEGQCTKFYLDLPVDND